MRPASHHLTNVVTGWFRTGSTEEKVKRRLYPQFRHAEATASIVPLGLARGLEAYVREYPYGCSEQITSRAMVKLIASTEADFGLSPKDAADALALGDRPARIAPARRRRLRLLVCGPVLGIMNSIRSTCCISSARRNCSATRCRSN